jgi:murein DD-endopeptidase MepM/ murein hydrolase activator NlpD
VKKTRIKKARIKKAKIKKTQIKKTGIKKIDIMSGFAKPGFTLFAFLFIFLALSPFTANSRGDEGDETALSLKDLTDSLEEIELLEKETKEVLTQTARLRETAESESDLLDADLIETGTRIYQIEAELSQARKEYAAILQSLSETRTLRDERYEIFKTRLAVAYENGETGYLEALLESENYSSVLRKIEYINSIIEHDNALVLELTELETQISDKTAESERKKEMIEIRLDDMRIKKKYLEAKLEEKKTLIENWNNDSAKLEEELNKLAESDRKIELAILEAYSSRSLSYSFGSGSGQIYTGGLLNWPVPGYYNISSQYSFRTSPISGVGEFHTGLDIPASYGSAVVAAESGTVIYADWMSGYGYTVVIGHDSSLSTLYGHNSALAVSKSDRVERGQTIARIGSTGYSTGPHCHFEVRIDGKHTNPNPYLYEEEIIVNE